MRRIWEERDTEPDQAVHAHFRNHRGNNPAIHFSGIQFTGGNVRIFHHAKWVRLEPCALSHNVRSGFPFCAPTGERATSSYAVTTRATVRKWY